MSQASLPSPQVLLGDSAQQVPYTGWQKQGSPGHPCPRLGIVNVFSLQSEPSVHGPGGAECSLGPGAPPGWARLPGTVCPWRGYAGLGHSSPCASLRTADRDSGAHPGTTWTRVECPERQKAGSPHTPQAGDSSDGSTASSGFFTSLGVCHWGGEQGAFSCPLTLLLPASLPHCPHQSVHPLPPSGPGSVLPV